ncbi:hypothetical protein FALCPG4_002728 [Fusarium falciforme]
MTIRSKGPRALTGSGDVGLGKTGSSFHHEVTLPHSAPTMLVEIGPPPRWPHCYWCGAARTTRLGGRQIDAFTMLGHGFLAFPDVWLGGSVSRRASWRWAERDTPGIMGSWPTPCESRRYLATPGPRPLPFPLGNERVPVVEIPVVLR